MRRAVVGLALGVALAACQASGGAPGPSSRPTAPGPFASTPAADLTVSAAASLQAALAEAVDAFQATNPGTRITVSTDASSALETKIEQGAQADVFLSADTANPQKLVDQGLAGGLTPFARNRLTIIVPAGNPGGVKSPIDLARPGLKVVAAGDAVPITTYATQLVANLAGQPGYPVGFAAAYAANVVSKEDNVAAVVAKVGLGEGDAAIVYGTDARASADVQAIAVPDAANLVATYGGVVLTASSNQVAARAFLAWLAGPGGQAILAGFGFLPPG